MEYTAILFKTLVLIAPNSVFDEYLPSLFNKTLCCLNATFLKATGKLQKTQTQCPELPRLKLYFRPKLFLTSPGTGFNLILLCSSLHTFPLESAHLVKKSFALQTKAVTNPQIILKEKQPSSNPSNAISVLTPQNK